jgi:hypothetical protein
VFHLNYIKLIYFCIPAILSNLYMLEAKSLQHITINKENLSDQLNLAGNQSISDFSRLGYALLYEHGKGAKVISLERPFSINESTKTFEFNEHDWGRQKALLRFAPNDRFVIYKNRQKRGAPTEIFDTLLNESRYLHQIDDGEEQNIDVLDLSTILYTSYSTHRRPRLYLVHRDEHHFLAEGGSAIWSPNGKWILLSEYAEPMTLMEKRRYGVLDKSIKKDSNKIKRISLDWSIYNRVGKKILQLKNIEDNICWSQWSDDSNYLVCRNLGVDGFVFFTFKQDETTIKVSKIYRFAGFPDEHQRYTHCSSPTLSPNGDYIAFFKITENNDREIERRLYLFDTKSKELQDLETVWIGSNDIKWVSSNQFFVKDGGQFFRYQIIDKKSNE